MLLFISNIPVLSPVLLESILALLHLDGSAGYVIRPEVAHDPVRETDDDLVMNRQIDDDALSVVSAHDGDPALKTHILSLRNQCLPSIPDPMLSSIGFVYLKVYYTSILYELQL